jgi:hypothetical protein
MLLELVGSATSLYWFSTAAPWESLPMAAWLTLTVCRLFSTLFAMISMAGPTGFMKLFESVGPGKPPVNGRNLKLISGEYNTLALVAYATAMGQCAILFEPGWPTSPAWMHTALIYGLSACMTLQFLRRAFLEDVLFPNRPFFGDVRNHVASM